MSSPTTNKEIFSALGEIKIVEGKKRFVPKSAPFLQTYINQLPLGKIIQATFSAKIPTRSQQQLSYHWVLMGYLAQYTGHSKEEMHDAVLRIKFGTKRIRLGDQIVDVRKSVSDKALFPKYEMVELIDYDLSLCAKMDIKVPTAEELGYIPNNKRIK